ncbi:MAG: hypothetical protein FWE41_04355 [Coriobacteriia bacterium]|nr:hypothetical protein [Coriobacteriia bacterium]
MFQFDLGQIGTLTPSPCSNLVHQPRPSVPHINILANYSLRLSDIDLSAVQPMFTATGSEAI